MTDELVQALKRLEQHADALMKVPPDEQGIRGIQAITSVAILEAKRAIEALEKQIEATRRRKAGR